MHSLETTRRRLLLGSAALAGSLALPGGPAFAQAKPFTVIGHAVHQRAATEGAGGNILEDWIPAHASQVEWLTFGVPQVHERLFREASLQQGSIDAAFLLNRFTDETIVNLFEPLDAFQDKDPIPDFDGISAGMRAAFTYGGALYGIPFRHATHGFHYNETLLAEQGFDRPPQTFEEVIHYAEKLTYTRTDGTQVHGFVIGGTGPANFIDVVRAHGGDFLTEDFQLKCNEPGTVRAVELLADFYKRGILPKAFVGFQTEDVITFMQQGRAAMSISPFDRQRVFNDPEKSKFPGQIKVMPTPLYAAEGEVKTIAAKTEVWSMVIPKNAADKDRAWSFIRQLSAPDATVRAAVNGNGPVRAAAYADPRVQAKVPWWEAEAAAIATARVPLPGFKNSARVDDMANEEVQAVLLGAKTAQQAMDDLAARIRPLLPS